jgi:hypothetical protein
MKERERERPMNGSEMRDTSSKTKSIIPTPIGKQMEICKTKRDNKDLDSQRKTGSVSKWGDTKVGSKAVRSPFI